MKPNEEINRIQEVFRTLGPVWSSGLDEEDPFTLTPGEPFCSEEDLLYAEGKMGIRIPEEYKIIVRYFGLPFFLGHKFMTIYPMEHNWDGQLPASDDMVAHYNLNIHHELLSEGELAFLETNDDGIFFFKCQPLASGSESSSEVYRILGNDCDKELLAPSMTAFLARWIMEES